jgi:hypothetical protein
MGSEEIRTVDPQGPWEYLDRRFFHVQGVVEECTGRNQSELSDLDWKTRQSLDLSGVTHGLNPQ